MNTRFVVAPLVASALFAVIPVSLSAQQGLRSAPVALPVVQDIPAAQDVPFPGTIKLDIDARDVTRGIFKITETVPVPEGRRELILLVPEWLPGKHAPRPETRYITNIRFAVDGKAAEWKRDPVDVNAFRIPVPAGATSVVATFDYTSPLQTSEGRIVTTQEMLNLQWIAMSLYPAGHYVRQVKVAPAVRFPEGWTVFTALDGQATSDGLTTWDTTDYDTLADSPVFAGKYARRFDLGHDIHLDAVADKPDLLEIKPEHLATYRKMADEAVALFGARHFDHYDQLVALTDRMGGIGLEHHRSSENGQKPNVWKKWDDFAYSRNTLPHELMHSWNGKYRRPARLWTPDFRTPMNDHLLWVYEGQTQFWGYVLAARSGVQPKPVVLGYMANLAALFSTQAGRAWRSVEDTTLDPIVTARKAVPYKTLNRGEDYYTEGMLVWLEADQVIRAGTKGKKGLDDFARAFFGMNDGDWGVLTYEFDDVVAALQSVYPYDWATFLRTRLYQPDQPAPLGGIEKGGYRLVWKDEPNPYQKGAQAESGNLDLSYSLGFTLDKEGKVSAPIWDSPAFDAGIVTGSQVVAVNGDAYTKDALLDAIKGAKGGTAPIELLVKRGTRYLTVPVDYREGLRFPWIEPVGEGEQPLDKLLKPRTN